MFCVEKGACRSAKTQYKKSNRFPRNASKTRKRGDTAPLAMRVGVSASPDGRPGGLDPCECTLHTLSWSVRSCVTTHPRARLRLIWHSRGIAMGYDGRMNKDRCRGGYPGGCSSACRGLDEALGFVTQRYASCSVPMHVKYANARCGGIPCRCNIAGVCLVEGGFCDCVGRAFTR